MPEMTTLYLIRHCESRVNAGEEHDLPRNDSALSAAGQAQAARLHAFLRPRPLSLILSSLFQRASATAAAIGAGRDVLVFPSMALNGYFLRDDGRGVESAEQGLARSLGFLLQFSPYYAHIAVVSHDTILATLLMSFLNLPFDTGKHTFDRLGTCVVLRYDYQQGDQHWRQIEMFFP